MTLAAAVGAPKVQPSRQPTRDDHSPCSIAASEHSQVRNADQPIALVVTNAVSTKTGLTYTFEVATDVAFASKAQTSDAIPEVRTVRRA